MTVENLLPVNPWYNIKNITVEFKELASASGIYPPILTGMPMNVQTDQPMKATFEWEQDGVLAGYALPLEFFVEVFLEKMGAGADLQFPAIPTPIPYNIGNPCPYCADIDIPAGAVAPGVYKVIVLFKAGFQSPAVDKFVAGFKEMGMLNVYQAD